MKWFLLMVFVSNGTLEENFMGVFDTESQCEQALQKLQKEEIKGGIDIEYRCTQAQEEI